MIGISKSESAITGFKIMRGLDYIESLDVDLLRSQLIQHKADWCKIKLNAADAKLFEKLEALGLPYSIYSSIYKNEIALGADYKAKKVAPEITYELYNGSQQHEFLDVVNASTDVATGVNYQNEWIDSILTTEIKSEINSEYILSYNHLSDPSKRAWLLKYNGNVAGYFMGIIKGKTFEGTLYGIHPDYRGLGLAAVVYQLMLKICVENGLEKFENDVQVLNTRSQSPTMREGVVPKAVYHHIIVYPFFSYAEKNVDAEINSPVDRILSFIDKFASGKRIDRVSWNYFDKTKSNLRLSISLPLTQNDKQLQIVLAKDMNDVIFGHGILIGKK